MARVAGVTFPLLWGSQALSLVGSSAATTALALQVFAETGSATHLAVILAALGMVEAVIAVRLLRSGSLRRMASGCVQLRLDDARSR